MGGAFSCSVHTHSSLCDGKDSLERMAEAAFAAGVEYFGFSGHIHTPILHDEGNVLPAGAEGYMELCRGLKERYAGKMDILLGIEWDSCSNETPPEGLDYWIASVHNLRGENGKYYSIDWQREIFAACRDEVFGGDVYAMISSYYTEVAAAASMKPTILGHIDLITKLNGDGSLFDEESAEYRSAALKALSFVDPESTLLEINTGAVARGYRSEPYPARFILEKWRSMGGKVIITSDAHRAEDIVFGYQEALEWAKSAGFTGCALLSPEGIRTAGI